MGTRSLRLGQGIRKGGQRLARGYIDPKRGGGGGGGGGGRGGDTQTERERQKPESEKGTESWGGGQGLQESG